MDRSQDQTRGDYEQVLYWKITEKPRQVLLLQIVACAVFILFALAFGAVAIAVGAFPAKFSFGIPAAAAILLGTAATFILHEVAHGITMERYGARPRYGVMWKQALFYATSPGYSFPRNSYIVVALAPLVGLSCLAILGMLLLQGTLWVALLALCATVNASGAVGDLWITSVVLRYPPIARIVDEKDGVRVLMPAGSAAA